jgi:hypothetical protein
MIRTWLITGILLGSIQILQAQSLIGLSKGEVVELVQQEYKEFQKDASVIKQTFNYLKYVNDARTKTWILHFNEADICFVSKLVCDYGELGKMVGMMNQKYTQKGKEQWEYLSGRDTIQVSLIRQEWYFTIREAKAGN